MQRDAPESKPRQARLEEKISKLARLPIVCFAANRTTAVGIQLVDDDVVNGKLKAVRLPHNRDRLAETHLLGEHHRNKTAAARILENAFHPLPGVGQFIQKRVQIVALVGVGDRPFHAAGLGQKGLDHRYPFAEELRQGKQPQGRTARSRIYDDAVVDALLHPRGYLQESHEFIRSEEHTSELQSRQYLVCRLLLE